MHIDKYKSNMSLMFRMHIDRYKDNCAQDSLCILTDMKTICLSFYMHIDIYE